MPEEKHSTGTQKRDDLITVALSLLMMPSPRSITSLPADRHLAGDPFGRLQNCLDYSIFTAFRTSRLGLKRYASVPLQDTSRNRLIRIKTKMVTGITASASQSPQQRGQGGT